MPATSSQLIHDLNRADARGLVFRVHIKPRPPINAIENPGPQGMLLGL